MRIAQRITLAALGLAVAGGFTVASLAQQGKPTAQKYTNVKWWQVMHVDYHAQHTEAALEIVFDKFVPAGRSSGMSESRFLEYTTGGQWDLTAMFLMPEGPGELEWEMSPDSIKWFGALAEQEGGYEAAEALMGEYLSMVNRFEMNVVRERVEPVSSTKGQVR